jgi:HEAT repeat protein
MRDPDPNVSYHAIEALGRLRAAEAMDDLAHVAASGDFFLSFPALDALARIGDATVARQIIPLLNDDLLCTAAADLLSQLAGEEAAMPLAALLNRAEAPAGATARGLATLYDRFEAQYREGAYIADLARPVITAKGVQNLLGAITAAQGDELRALALVLGWLEGPTVDRTLTRLLGQATARREVVEALVRHGPRVTSLLIEQLGAEELDTRQAAVIALGRIGDPAAVPALIQTLLADDRLTIVAAGALAKIGDRQAFDVLLGLLGEPDAAVRQAAISALNSLGHPDMPDRVAALFADPNPFVRESAAKIAGYFGYQQCIAGLLAACHDPDENVRRAAIENLTYLDIPEVLPAIIAALQNDTPKVRAGAARSLAHVESDQARPHLLTLLDDPDPWVRYYAARSIGRHAYPDALNALARLAQGDPGHHVRAAAMEALGRIGGPRAVAILAPLAEAEERDLARAALSALGLVGHPDAMPPLLAGLRSADRERRLDALHALGNRGGVGAAGALQWVAAADSDGIVAQAAIDALARLATPEAIAALIALTADTGRREACIAALANLSETQIELVAQGLEHPQPFVRRSVIEALARMKRSRASDQIINVLNDKDPAVRQTAAVALRRLGSPRAERRLASLAHSDPDVAVRRAAQLALQK